jgi:dienelactone hydrolase
MHEAGLTVTASRGAKVDAIADFPAGPGPFPAVVLAPGQGYPMARPAFAQTAARLVAAGVAVYRFNWAYSSAAAGPNAGAPSNDLADELQDLEAVIAIAVAEPRVNPEQVSVRGKSLGSVVAWRALAADRSLRSGLFLTPICSHVSKGQSEPVCMAQENYPGMAAERRPLLFIAGDRDPWCAPALLQRFVADAGGSARVVIVGGDHSFENPALTGAAADEARTRNVGAVAAIAARFIAQASGG